MICRYISIVCSALLYSFSATAQSQTLEIKSKKTDKEVYAEGRHYSRVLLIPYMSVMHLPDPAGDVEIVQGSGKDLKELQKYVRTSLDMSLSQKIKTLYKITPLLRSGTIQAQNDLEKIYSSVGYRYEKSMMKEPKDTSLTAIERVKKKITEKPEKIPGETKIEEGQIVTEEVKKNKQYMNVNIQDNQLISYLSNRYDADLFVFINQIEITKHFPDPSQTPYAAYHRMVRVHFSVIDKDSKQVSGDVASFLISKKTDNADDIISLSFPQIADYLFEQLPDANILKEEIKREKALQKKGEKQNLIKSKY